MTEKATKYCLFIITLLIVIGCKEDDKLVVKSYIYNPGDQYTEEKIFYDNDILLVDNRNVRVRNAFHYDRDTIYFFDHRDTNGLDSSLSRRLIESNYFTTLNTYNPRFKIDSILNKKSLYFSIGGNDYSIFMSSDKHWTNEESLKNDYDIRKAEPNFINLENDIVDFLSIDRYSYVYEGFSPQPILYFVGSFSDYIGIIIDSLSTDTVYGKFISTEQLFFDSLDNVKISIKDNILDMKKDANLIEAINYGKLRITVSENEVAQKKSKSPYSTKWLLKPTDIESLEIELDQKFIRIFSSNRIIVDGAYTINYDAGLMYINYHLDSHKKVVISRNSNGFDLTTIFEFEDDPNSNTSYDRIVTFTFEY